MNLSSKLLENAVEEISNLPGIGKRTALRLALHILKQKPEFAKSLTKSIDNLVVEIQYCSECNNLSDNTICNICLNPNRQKDVICIVENIRDVMAIENTQQYHGIYHVLGGKISPMEGIGPNDLAIESFIEKVKRGKVKEVIFALDSTIEGDTTNFYIYKQITDTKILISSLSKGIAVGGELEYVDEITLGRSILNRIPFEDTFIKET